MNLFKVIAVFLTIWLLTGCGMNSKQLKERSANIETLNRALAEDKKLLDNGAFKDVEVTGLVYKNGVINGGDWEGVTLNHPHFENVVFEGITFSGVVIQGGIFRNVTFRNSQFKVRKGVWDRENMFEPDEVFNLTLDGSSGDDLLIFYDKPHQNDSVNKLLITNSHFLAGNDGGSGLNIASDFDSMVIVDSTLDKGRAVTVTPANHLIIKDSTIKRSSFSSRELVKNYIVLDSEVDAASPLKVELMYVNRSVIGASIPTSSRVIVKQSKSIHFGMSSRAADLIYIAGCSAKNNKLFMGESTVKRMIVKDCDLEKFNYRSMQGGELTLCNSSIGKTTFKESKLQNAYWQNVHLNGPINLTNARIGTLHSHEVSGEEDVWEGLESVKVGRMNRCTEPMAFPEVEATVADAEQRVAELLQQLQD